MNPLAFVAPEHPAQVHELLAEHGFDAQLISGGTGLVNFLKQQLVQPAVLVSTGRLPGLERVEVNARGLDIGARVRQRDIEKHAGLQATFPLLAAAYGHVATVRIREMATLGGGLGQGDPAQDPPAVWQVLDGRIRLSSKSGTREVPAREFWLDHYTTACEPEEMIDGISAPVPPAGAGWSYQKYLPRSADDYAAVSVAALVVPRDGVIGEVRLALGSVAPTPVYADRACELLAGQRPTAELLRAAAESVREPIDPLDDARGSAEYKRDMAVVFARRALEQACARAGLALT